MHAPNDYGLAIGHLRQAAHALPAGAPPSSCTDGFRLRYLQFASETEALAMAGASILADADETRARSTLPR